MVKEGQRVKEVLIDQMCTVGSYSKLEGALELHFFVASIRMK